MKPTIILLVVFVATKQITSEKEGKDNVSNGTITSNNETEPTFKNIEDLFKNVVPNRNKNDLTLKGENATTTSWVEDLSSRNTTQDLFANSSTTGVNSTASVVKLEDIGSNTTNENVSTANVTEYESKKISKENSTIDDSSLNNTTREHLTSYSTLQEILSNITSTSEGPNQFTTKDVSNTIDESTKIYPDDDSISSDNDVTIAPELVTHDGTEISSDMITLDPQQHQNNCNSYIDKLLTATFTEHGDQLDPLILEDRKIAIENTFFLSSLKGEMGLYDGRVTGMSKAISFGECNVEISGDQIRLKDTISFDEAEIRYKGKAAFMEFGPKITVKGKLSGTLVELQIVAPKDGGIGEIKSVHVRNIGRMEVDVKGLGPINWAIGFITEDIVNAFRFNFRESVERELRKALEQEIKNINYP